MLSYYAYGLGIRSVLPLPELVAAKAAPDVVVRLASVGRLPSEAASMGRGFRATTEEVCLFYEEAGVFLVRGGKEIIVDPIPGIEERVLRLFILGPALAVLLHQRGLLVLHASAVAVQEHAVAFLGGSGWGKSTLAVALYAREHGVVADDVVAVEVDAGSPKVLPGFPQLKLWPEVAFSLVDNAATLPRLHPEVDKRALRVSRRFPHNPLPLSRIYVLAEGTRPELEPIRPQMGFVELLRHSYCAGLLKAAGTLSHFLQCTGVAQSVPMRRLKIYRSLAALPDLIRVVKEDIAGM